MNCKAQIDLILCSSNRTCNKNVGLYTWIYMFLIFVPIYTSSITLNLSVASTIARSWQFLIWINFPNSYSVLSNWLLQYLCISIFRSIMKKTQCKSYNLCQINHQINRWWWSDKFVFQWFLTTWIVCWFVENSRFNSRINFSLKFIKSQTLLNSISFSLSSAGSVEHHRTAIQLHSVWMVKKNTKELLWKNLKNCELKFEL